MAHAQELQAEGKARKQAALDLFDAEKKACFKKFMVTNCQLVAKKRYNESMKEARRISNEGGTLERQVKKERLEDKDARRVEDAPRREADLRDRQARTAEDRDLAEQERQKKGSGQGAADGRGSPASGGQRGASAAKARGSRAQGGGENAEGRAARRAARGGRQAVGGLGGPGDDPQDNDPGLDSRHVRGGFAQALAEPRHLAPAFPGQGSGRHPEAD